MSDISSISRYMAILAIITIQNGCSSNLSSSTSLTLATTTSTRDSGLLDVLVPAFESRSGYRVKVLAVGSGQALELGRRGDADVLLTHAPLAEQELVDAEYAESRIPIMFNDFVLVGPAADVANIKNESSIVAAMRDVARAEARFVSRGDQSGTHLKEQSLWQEADIVPQRPWYIASGTGMAATLRIASEKEAYTLADRATFLAHKEHNRLQIILQGDPRLENPYAALVVSHQKHPHTNHQAAVAFVDFLKSEEARTIIGSYGEERYDSPLFFLFPEERE